MLTEIASLIPVLENKLAAINRHRRQHYRLTIALITLLIPAYWIAVYYANGKNVAIFYASSHAQMAFLGVLGGCLGIYHLMHKRCAWQPKREIVSELMKIILPEAEFFPHARIGSEEFLESKIFTQSLDHIEGEDLITGKRLHVSYKISELWTQQLRQRHYVTTFRGLFAVFETSRMMEGRVIITPDTMERYHGRAVSMAYQSRLRKEEKLVRLSSPEFEYYFTVYADQPGLAEETLTVPIREFLTELQKHVKGKVYASFTGRKVFIGIRTGRDAFDTRFNRDITLEEMMQYAQTLLDLSKLVDAIEKDYQYHEL